MKVEYGEDVRKILHNPSLRGVIRLEIDHNASDVEVNNAVRAAVRDMARQGKRIASIPKRLQDGIALDWVLDLSVKTEDADKALSRVIPGLKHESDYTAGSSASEPILIDDSDDEMAPSNTPARARLASEPTVGTHDHDNNSNIRERSLPVTPSHNNRSRPRSDTLRQYTIQGIPSHMNVSGLLQAIIRNGISEETILDLRIRDTPGGRVATVYVNNDGDAAALQHSLGSVTFEDPTSSAATRPAAPTNRPLQRERGRAEGQLVSGRSTPGLAKAAEDGIAAPPPDINEDDSAELTCSAAAKRSPDPDPLADENASPALSYLTLEEDPEEHLPGTSSFNGDEHESGSASPASHEQHVDPEEGYHWATASMLSSSDREDETDDDGDGEPQKPGASYVLRHPEEDLAQRLLNGPLEGVRSFVQNTPEAQRKLQMLHARNRPVVERRTALDSSSTNTNGRRRARQVSEERRVINKARVETVADAISIPENTISATVPKALHAKGRRVIVPPDSALPVAAVYMRGDVQFVDQTERSHIPQYSLPVDNDEHRLVTDALMLDDDTIVVGYDRGPSQVSCIVFNDAERPVRADIRHKGHNRVYEKRGTSMPNPGIACLASIPGHERRFLSGGYDGTIRSWRLSSEHPTSAKSKHLDLSPEQPVRCIAYRGATTDVFAAHTKHLYVAALEAPKSAKPYLLSAEPQQIHVHPHNANIIVLEVDHLDNQVQIFDTRAQGFDRRPSIEFGHRDTGRGGSSSSMKHRWRRGSTRHALFARGYGDGSLVLWDYRQPASLVVKERRWKDPIVHTVLTDSQIITYGAYTVTFWETSRM